MADTKINVRDNGPLMVVGPVTIVDGSGNEYTTEGNVFLCRCGQSNKKPFCDGTHKACGFESEARV